MAVLGNPTDINAAEMFSLYTFQAFFNLPFVQVQLCWANPHILTGETPMLSRVKLSFLFFDANSLYEICCNNFCLVLIFR